MQAHKDFPNLHIVDHPLVQHKLTWLRKVDTPTNLFRTLLKEISLLMGYEITHNVPLTKVDIKTPMQAMRAMKRPSIPKNTMLTYQNRVGGCSSCVTQCWQPGIPRCRR